MTEQQQQPEPVPVWGGTIDNERFTAMVERSGEYGGVLTVKVNESGEELLHEDVSLSYDAIFGPDVADVMEWERKTIESIDAWLVAHGEQPPEPSS